MIHIFITFRYGKISRKANSEANSSIFAYRHLSCKQVLKFRFRGMSTEDQRCLVLASRTKLKMFCYTKQTGTDALIKEMPEATLPFRCPITLALCFQNAYTLLTS